MVEIKKNLCKSRDSSVGVALCYGLDDRGSRLLFSARTGNFSLSRVQNGSGAHPTSFPMATGALSLGVKRPGREADHLPPSSAEVKKARSYTSTPPIRLHGEVFKYRDNFTFTLSFTLCYVVVTIDGSEYKYDYTDSSCVQAYLSFYIFSFKSF